MSRIPNTAINEQLLFLRVHVMMMSCQLFQGPCLPFFMSMCDAPFEQPVIYSASQYCTLRTDAGNCWCPTAVSPRSSPASMRQDPFVRDPSAEANKRWYLNNFDSVWAQEKIKRMHIFVTVSKGESTEKITITNPKNVPNLLLRICKKLLYYLKITVNLVATSTL